MMLAVFVAAAYDDAVYVRYTLLRSGFYMWKSVLCVFFWCVSYSIQAKAYCRIFMSDISKRKSIEYIINIVRTFASEGRTSSVKIIIMAQRCIVVYRC
jgi:hypothetical protein